MPRVLLCLPELVTSSLSLRVSSGSYSRIFLYREASHEMKPAIVWA